MVNLKINITAVPERLDNVYKMVNKLKKETDNVEILLDTNHKGLIWNWKRSLLAFDKDKDTHVLSLDDDITFCDDFVKTLLRIIKLLPDEFISLHSTQQCVAGKINKGYNLIRMAHIHGIAMLYPIKDAVKTVKFFDEQMLPTYPHDDYVTISYLRYNDRYVVIPIPTLVEHLPIKSTRKGVSYAPSKYFIGQHKSGMDFNWEYASQNIGECYLKIKHAGINPLSKAYRKLKDIDGIDKDIQNRHLKYANMESFNEP